MQETKEDKEMTQTKYTKSLFEKIKENLNTTKGSSGFKDMLRLSEGNNYLVRLVPNIDNINETFHHYYNFGWESKATGQYVSAISPITIGERCPIDEARRKLYAGSEEDKKLAQALRRTEQWLVNCYVVENPTDDASVGQVKILRYGKQLDKIITDAISGDDADEYGPAIFDLSEDGCNFRIKVENVGGYRSYVSSRFLKSSALPGVTDSKINDIYNNMHDLSELSQIKSYDELQEMLDVHLFNSSTSSSAPSLDKPDDDDIPYEFNTPKAKPAAKKKVKKEVVKEAAVSDESEDGESIDDAISDLIEGLDI